MKNTYGIIRFILKQHLVEAFKPEGHQLPTDVRWFPTGSVWFPPIQQETRFNIRR